MHAAFSDISRNTIKQPVSLLRTLIWKATLYTKWKFSLARNGATKYRGETGLTSVGSPPRRCVSTGKRKRRLGKSRVPLTTWLAALAI